MTQTPSAGFEDDQAYKVVVNHEGQYSIWPLDRENAIGWRDAGSSGSKAECLNHIGKVWTDMRPAFLKKAPGSHDRAGASALDVMGPAKRAQPNTSNN